MSEDKAVFRACGNCGCRIDGFCVSEVAKENNCAMDPDLPCWIPEGFAKVVAQCTEKPDTIKKNNQEPDFFQQKLREQRDEPGHNNGGSTDYYKFKHGWTDCQDIIEDRQMNFSQGNIFKAAFCFNTGRHPDASYERELNKIVWFAQRELDRIKEGGE